MKAAVYQAPGIVTVEEIPLPEIGEGEVLVRVAVCGVCATDLKKIYKGLQPPPRIYGHEIAGVIEQVGPGIERFKPGDRVVVFHHIPCGQCNFCTARDYAQCPIYRKVATTAGFEPAGGGFAQYLKVFPWGIKGLLPIPEDVPFEEAALVEPVNTCLKAVRRASLSPGQTVALYGLGFMGLLFLPLLIRQGVRVTGIDPIDNRRQKALELGAEEVFTPEEFRLRQEPSGPDLALIATPALTAVKDAVEKIRPGGKVLLFAQTEPGQSLPIDLSTLCMQEKTLLGSYGMDPELLPEAAQLVFNRLLPLNQWITHRFPLEEAPQALAKAHQALGETLKVMVYPWGKE